MVLCLSLNLVEKADCPLDFTVHRCEMIPLHFNGFNI